MNDEITRDDPLNGMVELLRRPVPIAPGLERRTGKRQKQLRRGRFARGASLVLLVLIVELVARRPASGTTVTFSLAAPSVRSVTLVGDFTDWRPDRISLERGNAGLWHATLKLPPGRYRFAYIVDHDQWRADSNASNAPDDFGRPTSVLTVAGN